MPLSHDNLNQRVTPVDFKPLLKDEAPYFVNLNRPAKDAYVYADNINRIYSYSGCVTVLPAAQSSSVHSYHLYEIVKIADDEYAIQPDPGDASTARYGIVVEELNSENRLVICTFSPNFVYPMDLWSEADIGSKVYFNPEAIDRYYLVTNTYNSLTIPAPLGVITGTKSIFFSGTLRNLVA